MVRFALVAFLLAVTLLGSSLRAQLTQPTSKNAAVVTLAGQIDDFNKSFVEKRFGEARKLGADTVILKINTYGGLVTSGLEISQFLKQQNDLHVIGFIEKK